MVAIAAIRGHVRRGSLSDGLILDAVRVRLIEIGEAVKALSPSLLVTEPDIPWRQIAGMRESGRLIPLGRVGRRRRSGRSRRPRPQGPSAPPCARRGSRSPA
ncbi:MAG: HepT-like ribonuclease domain-containing protein [Egibacteraceae bacterium]